MIGDGTGDESGARPARGRGASPRRRQALRAGALAAAVVGVMYLVVGDGVPAGPTGGVEGLVVDRFHALTWLLLAAGTWTAASPRPAVRRWWKPLLLAALLAYLAFRWAVHDVS